MKKTLVTCALLCGAIGAHAQQAPAKNLYLLIGGGLTFGGDQIGNDLNYDDGTSKSIQAGGFGDFRVGVEYAPVGLPVTFQANLAYHFDTANAKNGRASFDRLPLELLTHYAFNENWRVGLGLRKALSAETKSSGAATGYVRAEKYESSMGVVAEVEYLITPQFGVKVRGVSEKYKPESNPNREVSGDHIGVLATYYFK